MAKLMVTTKMEIWKEQNKGHEFILNFRRQMDNQDVTLMKGTGEESQSFNPETSGYASDSSNESEKIFRNSQSELKKVSPVVNSAFSIDSILGKQDTKKNDVFSVKEDFRKRDNYLEEKEEQDEGAHFLNSLNLPMPHPGK